MREITDAEARRQLGQPPGHLVGLTGKVRWPQGSRPGCAPRAHSRSRSSLRVRSSSAGVPVTTVRYDGTIHDFMLLNALSETQATRAAIGKVTALLRAGLCTG
jgi:hypothetical protein